MATLTVITYNINGVNNPIKRNKILTQLKRLNCSIAMLQETHLNETEHKKLRRAWVGQVYSSSCERGRQRGVDILCHRSLGFVLENKYEDKKGRYILAIGTIRGVRISLLNIYAPNQDDPSFFKEFSALLTTKADRFIIAGGDFNCVMNHKMDKYPYEERPVSQKAKILPSLIEEMGLIDIWCQSHPKECDYTFFSKVHGSYSRIDLFCFKEGCT